MRSIRTVLMAGAVTCLLGGCAFLPFFPGQLPQVPQAPQAPEAPDSADPADAPAGWAELPPCDQSDLWIYVDGFPVDELESAGFAPECGGTYFDPDVVTYISAGDRSVTPDELDAIRSELEASGYVETASTFEPPDAEDAPGLVGSFQLERGSEIIYLVNIWEGTDPVTYLTFVDYESPATAALVR